MEQARAAALLFADGSGEADRPTATGVASAAIATAAA
jgi:hypothetical protein